MSLGATGDRDDADNDSEDVPFGVRAVVQGRRVSMDLCSIAPFCDTPSAVLYSGREELLQNVGSGTR